MKERTCTFSNCGSIPQRKIEKVVKKISSEIDQLIEKGVTEFMSSGEIGINQIAATYVIAKKQLGADIRLKLVLPYRSCDEKLEEKQKRQYDFLISEADEVMYLSDKYTPDCIRENSNYMVDNSAYLLCASSYESLRYALRDGLSVIKVA